MTRTVSTSSGSSMLLTNFAIGKLAWPAPRTDGGTYTIAPRETKRSDVLEVLRQIRLDPDLIRQAFLNELVEDFARLALNAKMWKEYISEIGEWEVTVGDGISENELASDSDQGRGLERQP